MKSVHVFNCHARLLILFRLGRNFCLQIVEYFLAASESQMGRFETHTLTAFSNLSALANLSGKWIDKVQRLRKRPNLILDIDSSESPVHGSQEGSAYNGHFAKNCYHPLFRKANMR